MSRVRLRSAPEVILCAAPLHWTYGVHEKLALVQERLTRRCRLLWFVAARRSPEWRWWRSGSAWRRAYARRQRWRRRRRGVRTSAILRLHVRISVASLLGCLEEGKRPGQHRDSSAQQVKKGRTRFDPFQNGKLGGGDDTAGEYGPVHCGLTLGGNGGPGGG